MAYKFSKGNRGLGDIEFEDDSDTGIDFEEDYIALQTSGSAILVVSGSKVAIGPTPPGVGSFPSYRLDINGDIRIRGNDIRDNSGSPAISFDGQGNVGTLQITSSIVPDEALEQQAISFYLDEGNNQLKVKVKYSDNSIKTGTISLS